MLRIENHTHFSYSKHIIMRILTHLFSSSQGDFLAGFTIVAVHYFHVPLGCGYTLVSHHALYGADVRSGSRLQRSECAATGVECNLLADSSRTDPPFHVSLGPTALLSLEYHSPLVRAVANKVQCFLADVDDVLGAVLLGDDVYALATGRIVHDQRARMPLRRRLVMHEKSDAVFSTGFLQGVSANL